MILTRKRLLALLFIFLALAALLFVFQDAVRQLVIVPIQYFAWFAALIYHSVDQQVVWSLLFLLALFIGLQLLYESFRPAGSRPLPLDSISLGQARVGAWLMPVRFMLRGGTGQDYFAAEVRRLMLAILAYRENLTPKEVEQRIAGGSIVIPEQLLFAFQSRTYRPPNFWARVRRDIQSVFASIRRNNKEQDEERKLILQAIVQFLEEQMEES